MGVTNAGGLCNPDKVKLMAFGSDEDRARIAEYDQAVAAGFLINIPGGEGRTSSASDGRPRGAREIGVKTGGSRPTTFDAKERLSEIFKNPHSLEGKTPKEVGDTVGSAPGWRIETLGKGSREGQGWVLRQYTEDGETTGRMLRWHPGGGHHGPDPYWRVVSGEGGSVPVGPQFKKQP